jgi:hypothetical protein
VILLSNVANPSPDQINRTLGSNLRNVTRWSTPVTVFSPGAAAAVVVHHDLGTVPNTIEVEPFVDGRTWWDQDDRRTWSETQIVFRSSHQGSFVVRAGVQ